MLYPTTNGSRPDLALAAKATQADMGGYAFPQLFPVLATTERAGDFSYAPANLPNSTTNVAEGRANGAALTATELKTEDFAWTTAPLEARSVIYDREVPGWGGIAQADEAGGIDCVRRAYNKVEQVAYAKTFSAARILAAVSLADQQIINLFAKAAIAVRPYGQPYLVCTTNGLLKLLQIPEVRKAMFGSFTAAQVMNMLTGTDKELILSKLSPLLSMKGIVIFDSDIVTGANDDCIAIVALRPEAFAGGVSLLNTAKARAIYGFTAVYIPTGATSDMPFGVSSTADGKDKANYYDAESRYSVNEIHTGAVKCFKMLADIASYTENVGPLKVEITNPSISTPAE